MCPDDFLGEPADPFDAAPQDHEGVRALLDARELLLRGDAATARDRCHDARRAGVPTELVPHLHLVEGIALLLCGDHDAALATLANGWRDHPDFAALPATLGVVQFRLGAPAEAARTMFAALIGEDPDGSLARYRTQLTALLSQLGAS